MNEHRRRARLSLRSLLVSLTTVGVTAGLLGRWFFTSPDLFRAAIVVLFVVVPYVAMGVALIRIGRSQRQAALVVGGAAAFVAPLVGSLILNVIARFQDTSPGGLRSLSNTAILATRLPQEINQPWVWRELDQRLAAGMLKPEEVDAAIDTLSNHMATTRPGGWNQPISWQRGFLDSAIASGKLSEPALLRLCDAFFATTPKLTVVGKPDEGGSELRLEIDLDRNPWVSHSGIPVQLVWWPERFLLDGAPLPPVEPPDAQVTNLFSGDVENGRWTSAVPLSVPLVAGDHELSVEIRFAFIDTDKLVGLPKGASPSDRWPSPRKRWTQTVATNFEATDPAQPRVRLSTDPAHDPRKTGALGMGRLVMQADRPGQSRLVYVRPDLVPEPIPLAFDVSVVIAGETRRLGSVGAFGNATFGSGRMQAVLPTPDASIATADIVFEPNREIVADRSEVEVIWGKRMELRGVPVERLDLEARAAKSRSSAVSE